MGGKKLEQEGRSRVDYRRDRAGDGTALWLIAGLLDQLLWPLARLARQLLLVILGTGLALRLFGGTGRRRAKARKQQRPDDQLPLHNAQVTTWRMNRK